MTDTTVNLATGLQRRTGNATAFWQVYVKGPFDIRKGKSCHLQPNAGGGRFQLRIRLCLLPSRYPAVDRGPDAEMSGLKHAAKFTTSPSRAPGVECHQAWQEFSVED